MTLIPNRNCNYQFVDLIKILQEKNFEMLIDFMNNHGGLNGINEYGRTVVMECIIESKDLSDAVGTKFAMKLLEKGADINVKDKGGYTALHFAMQNNNQEMLDYLLTKPKIDATTIYQVLIKALMIRPNDLDMLMKLVQAGNPFHDESMEFYNYLCDLQKGTMRFGDMPIDMTPILEYLHQHYPQKVSHIEPFFLAGKSYHYLYHEFRSLLNKKKMDLLMEFIHNHGGINGIDEYGRTPLINCMVAYKGLPRGTNIKQITTKLAVKLIGSGADVCIKDDEGYMALDYAIKHSNEEIVSILRG